MIGRDLRTIREACGVSMGDLADAVGWPLPIVSNVERNVLPVSPMEAEHYITNLAQLVRARRPVTVINGKLRADR